MKNLYLISLLLLIFASCEDVKETYIPIDEQLKKWGEFKPESYWIYQNDNTLELCDTIKVTRDFKGTGYHTYGEISDKIDFETSYDWIQCYARMPLIANSETLYRSFILVKGTGLIVWSEEYSNIGINIGLIRFKVESGEVINEKISIYENEIEVEYISEIDILGVNYQDIAFITVNDLNTANTYKYWVAKNTWIVKKEFILQDTSYSWSLREYKIVR